VEERDRKTEPTSQALRVPLVKVATQAKILWLMLVFAIDDVTISTRSGGVHLTQRCTL
jgi:hypothetical protein